MAKDILHFSFSEIVAVQYAIKALQKASGLPVNEKESALASAYSKLERLFQASQHSITLE